MVLNYLVECIDNGSLESSKTRISKIRTQEGTEANLAFCLCDCQMFLDTPENAVSDKFVSSQKYR
jgi:hypothetical protein